VQDVLGMNDHRTYPAENGREALEILEWLRADLIVSDIMMPVMGGYEFYRQVRSRPEWLHIPFIFLTAKGSQRDVMAGKQLGADDYLVKPFSANELLVVVNSKLAMAQRWKQVQQQELAVIKRNILKALNHEFRTPLSYISTYTSILAESGGKLDQKDFQEFCQAIAAGGQRLQSLVEDFLFWAQLETGEAKLDYESRRILIDDLTPLLQMVIASYQEQAREKQLSIHPQMAGGLRPVVADSDYLVDAIGRLIGNAIKFSPKGADPIVVSADMAGDMLRIAVSDHGVGIPPEAMGGLFQVLYQVDRDKMEQQGSGSGLAITKAIVMLHGGEIQAESEPNVGSTFTILLPVTKRDIYD